MASQEDRNALLNSLRPIFPQLSDKIIEESIHIVRGTVGEVRELIIPACIDYLLARNTNTNQPNNGENAVLPILIEDETTRAQPLGSKRKRISDLEVSFVEDLDDDELLYVATSVLEGNKEVYMIDDSPPLASSRDCVIVPNLNSVGIPKNDAKKNLQNIHKSNDTTLNSSTCSSSTHYSSTLTNNTNVISNSNSSSTAVSAGNLNMLPSNLQVTDPLTYSTNQIKLLFPDIQEKFLQEKIYKWTGSPAEMIINNVCNTLLEHGYPKEEEKTQTAQATTTEADKVKVDYLNNYKSFPSGKYIEQCIALLENEFPKVSVNDIKTTARKNHYHYAPTRKYLEEKLVEAYDLLKTQTSPSNISGQSPGRPIRLMKGKRQPRKLHCLRSLDPELQKEIDFIKQYKVSEAEEKDRQMAFKLNDEQYEAEGQLIECGCCYVEATFEDMVQCLDGHLFCVSCLRNYAKEAVFGQGKAILSCMTGDCDSTFPMTQLQRSLESNILSKYEDRLAEESLCLAEMDDLVRCPHCDFAAIMPPDDKVFKCQNASCLKETCRYCKEEWKEHFGLKCSEIEKNDEKNMRLSYEEKMTMAKIRKCHKCGCEFTKSDGCNKMTCRCGTTMCYICRKPSISYNHFCQHPKDPGHNCKTCSNCSLWSDPSEDDNMAVKQIEREAKQAQQQLTDTRAEEETPSKKRKTSHEGANIPVHNVAYPIF